MPLVRITLRKGKSAEYLREISDCVHNALVAEANVPADDRFHVIEEVDAERLIAHPTYAGMERSESVIFVQIILNAGRTVEVKKALYADMVRRMEEAVDVRPDDVLISLVEVTKENWSFGKGLATYA